jgi:Protein of unknown function (DUF3562)
MPATTSMEVRDHGAFDMHDQTIDQTIDDTAEIEILARETDMPFKLVEEIYSCERARLERTARIKTYVPVLIHRQVKALLREHRSAA